MWYNISIQYTFWKLNSHVIYNTSKRQTFIIVNYCTNSKIFFTLILFHNFQMSSVLYQQVTVNQMCFNKQVFLSTDSYIYCH